VISWTDGTVEIMKFVRTGPFVDLAAVGLWQGSASVKMDDVEGPEIKGLKISPLVLLILSISCQQ
jgi:hypothetical protein